MPFLLILCILVSDPGVSTDAPRTLRNEGPATTLNHYYTKLNQRGQKGLTEAAKPSSSVKRSQLIVALIEAVALTASVKHLMEAGKRA